MSQLAVIIVNYKTPNLVTDCLETLLPELTKLDAKVIIVDNHSNDDSCGKISGWILQHDNLNQVVLIASDENSGFSAGNNLGISQIKAEYYLLLNSDTLVNSGAIVSLIEAASSDDCAGLVSPRLEWPDATPQESCFRFHTPISELISSANTGLITTICNRFNVPWPVIDEAGYYDWTSFACVLVKAHVFEELGLLDDGYFMYYEDVAFSLRAQKAGWKVLNVPNAHIVHLRGGSSPVKSQAKLRKRLPRYYYESRTRFFYQAYGRLGLLAANMFWTLGWAISLVRQIFSPKFVPNISQSQWRDIWINFSNPLEPFFHPDSYDKT